MKILKQLPLCEVLEEAMKTPLGQWEVCKIMFGHDLPWGFEKRHPRPKETDTFESLGLDSFEKKREWRKALRNDRYIPDNFKEKPDDIVLIKKSRSLGAGKPIEKIRHIPLVVPDESDIECESYRIGWRVGLDQWISMHQSSGSLFLIKYKDRFKAGPHHLQSIWTRRMPQGINMQEQRLSSLMMKEFKKRQGESE